jgi:hypothetical protein
LRSMRFHHPDIVPSLPFSKETKKQRENVEDKRILVFVFQFSCLVCQIAVCRGGMCGRA